MEWAVGAKYLLFDMLNLAGGISSNRDVLSYQTLDTKLMILEKI